MNRSGYDPSGTVFDIDTFAVHDGPGIRMTVFLKGCRMRCKWCHSPESWNPEPELVFFRDRCDRCGLCVQVCPQEAHTLSADKHLIDRNRCAVCGTCGSHCPERALEIKGRRMKASEIVAKAVRFKPFFKYSGGGLTLTGGEATEQPEFAAAILEGCRSEGIHAALETNGSCGPEILSRLAGLSDLILFDLKLFDDEAHRSLTGISNRRILSNAKLISGHPNMIVRIPLIPGMTDCDADLDATFSFMARTGLRRVSLLPYNPSTAAKYDWIGLSFSSNAETQTAERIREINGQASRYGIETVTI